jgi:myo-inositol-1(or 4)-monophosphatase
VDIEMSAERYAFAQSVARRAGALAHQYFRDRERLTVELKGPQDFVSHADRDVESLLRREIKAAFPDDGFLGEETAASFSGALERCWIIDPIDGTHNFLRGIPYWNVAIAFVERGPRADIGVVFDPVHDELFRARRGEGAWCDTGGGTTRLHVADTSTLPGAFVALGHHDRVPDPHHLEIRRRMMQLGISMRNFGSGALQLAHVACGRLDGFIELQLSIWDAIGALVVVDEAGGRTAPFVPTPITAKAACLASTPGLFDALGKMSEIPTT